MPAEHQAERFDLLSTARRSWRLILVCSVVGAALFGGIAGWRSDSFTSQATVLYRPSGQTPGAFSASSGTTDPTRALTTQAAVMTGDEVMRAAAEEVDLEVRELRERVQVEVVDDSDILQLAGSGPTPDEARQVTTAVIDSYVGASRAQTVATLTAQIDGLQVAIDALNTDLRALAGNDPETDGQRRGLTDQVTALALQQAQAQAAAATERTSITVLSAATLPAATTSAGPLKASVIGFAAGMAVGVSLTFLGSMRRGEVAAGER